MIGATKKLTIYDTAFEHCDDWREAFSIEAPETGLAVAWGPTIVRGLAYLAYGGNDRTISIVEIRTNEGTWEKVLSASRDDVIHALDWNFNSGLLAAAVANGTVSILDLSYLQSGSAVNELSYNAQRQALTCFTELRRNRGKNIMRAVRWIPAPLGSDTLLAVGGSDGEVEILDLTDRERCRGFQEQRHN
jgi:WD40 repeat protein